MIGKYAASIFIHPHRSVLFDGTVYVRGDEGALLEALGSSTDMDGALLLATYVRTGTISVPEELEEELNDLPRGWHDPEKTYGSGAAEAPVETPEATPDTEEDSADPVKDSDKPYSDTVQIGAPPLVDPDGRLTDAFPHVDKLRRADIADVNALLQYPDDYTSIRGVGEAYAKEIENGIAKLNR